MTAGKAAADVPKGEQVGDKRCFTVDEYKQMLTIDEEKTICEKDLTLYKQSLQIRSEQINLLGEVYKDTLEKNKLLLEENDRLFNLWKDENEKRHKAENAPKFGNWISWGIAGAALAVAGGALTYAAFK